MIRVVAVRIRIDMTIQQPDLARFHDSVSIFQIDAAFPRRFDFCSREHKAGFELFDDLVIVERLTIDRDILHLGCVPFGAPNTVGAPNMFGPFCGVPNWLGAPKGLGAACCAPMMPGEGCCCGTAPGNSGFCWGAGTGATG